MPNHPATFLEIDLDALTHNYQFFRNFLHPDVKILAVVKAFAYGHEAVAVAKKLAALGVDYLAVAFVREAIPLRMAGIQTPILVLHPQVYEVTDCLTYKLEPNLYSFRILKEFTTYFKEKGIKDFPVHLKFNTGLNRLGFKVEEADSVLDLIEKEQILSIKSVFSHLVASEDPDEKVFTQQQIAGYQKVLEAYSKRGYNSFIKHMCNTSGTLNYPEAHFDMVRIGIGMYGYANETKWTKKLKNVGSLVSIISQIHEIKKGESIGYNRGFIADKKIRTATIPLGHADGIPRSWSQGVNAFFINGKKASILGNVCMDMTMVDVTDIDCKEGDQVVLFDSQERLIELAHNTQTISYEVLTAISQRVPRVIKNDV